MQKKKVLLLGSQGALGRELSLHFLSQGVPFLSINRINFNINQDKKTIANLLKQENIYLVLNCIAMTGLDKCFKNKKESLIVNYFFPKKMSFVCQSLDIKFIQFSTDNVFSCDKIYHIYNENDDTLPTTWYGVSKLMGELSVLSTNNQIIRFPMLFGPTNDSQLIAKLLGSVVAGNIIQVANDIYSTPVYTPDVANLITRKIISDSLWSERIIHLSGDKVISLFEFMSSLLVYLPYKGSIESVSCSNFETLESKPKYGGLESISEKCFSLDSSIITYTNYLNTKLKERKNVSQ